MGPSLRRSCRALLASASLGSIGFLLGGAAPMTYLAASGQKARMVLPLTIAVTVIALAVIAIIFLLVTIGSWRGRSIRREDIAKVPLAPASTGLSWIYVGTGISGVVLLAILIWTMWVLVKVYLPATRPPLTILVTAHQWWWEAKYIGTNPSDTFTTANEIHIPAGMPVMFKLESHDVIHSFWVPLLNGKMDVIPGQTNVTWLDASHPGVYRGQCGEYCGVQHAQMAMFVVAQTPADFQVWWRHQLGDSPLPQSDAARSGMESFNMRCSACHAIRGTDAGGIVGPDLSHLASRKTIAAGILENTPGNLSAWIANPQSIKPGSMMPTLTLTGHELEDINAYLETLK